MNRKETVPSIKTTVDVKNILSLLEQEAQVNPFVHKIQSESLYKKAKNILTLFGSQSVSKVSKIFDVKLFYLECKETYETTAFAPVEIDKKEIYFKINDEPCENMSTEHPIFIEAEFGGKKRKVCAILPEKKKTKNSLNQEVDHEKIFLIDSLLSRIERHFQEHSDIYRRQTFSGRFHGLFGGGVA